MRIVLPSIRMARVNLYVPDDIQRLIDRHRDRVNLSTVFARAIRDELEAAEGHRDPAALFSAFAPPSEVEVELRSAYGLKDALVVALDHDVGEAHIRERLGVAAASYLNTHICDGAVVGMAGGRQNWCIVRALQPRRVQATIVALGVGHADPKLLHAHSNTLTTLLWLLYSPRSEAHVIASQPSLVAWTELPHRKHPTTFIFASCSTFDANSSFGQLIPEATRNHLVTRGAVAEFAYVFMDDAGREITIQIDAPHAIVPAAQMRALAERNDVRIILTAGGRDKLSAVRLTLQSGLCNMLITDANTATALVS